MEFMKPSASVDAAVLAATSGRDPSFEGMREAMKAALVGEGRMERGDRESLGFGARGIPERQTSDASMPANGFKFEREFKYAPSSDRRSLMLRANTQADLDALARQMERTI